ncbi:MAG: AAA family ATPase [Spirulina sp.]
MVSLTGYENFVQIYESVNSQVYRARRISDTSTATLHERQPVILKFLKRDYPTSEQIRRYKQEYHLTCQLDAPGIIKAYSLEQWQRSYAIVLEDFGGISLQQWLKKRKTLELQEFLELAISMTESLGQIHDRDIIHKDINPANIVVNPETKELKIIDFGISTQLNRENPTLKNPNVLEGTLAYISPEQTGRMNRVLDYRTDFYSLGVTFYELLTGKLPFTCRDPLELIHCHIAKSPPVISHQSPVTSHQAALKPEPESGFKSAWGMARFPRHIQPSKTHCPEGSPVISYQLSIPKIIEDIVMKLMAKNAEDRYQSAYGLKADLEECRRQLEETGNITHFLLGQQDISDRFHIPQKLYGREKEIETLLAAFNRVTETGTVELMLVSGYSGIGKSALVQELYKPITASRGYFISGKFDQFQRNIPYSAIVAAFRGLIGQLLGENAQQLQVWREKLLQALGNNGQIIINAIPEVELIIGKQSPIPVLGANETENRFNLVMGNFIRVFCHREHPLTLFLDDLQWADLATLKLLERILVGGQTQYLLLLGAYRDNEVSLGHPLAIALEKLQPNNATIAEHNRSRIATITLAPLPEDQIARLIGETLHKTPENLRDLARLVQEKTGGNPFFVNEFLQALYHENLLQFHRQERSWQWDIEVIKRRGFTDNVVELMVEKLQKLPPSVREILSLSACWGAEFDLKILTRVEQKTEGEIFALLKKALHRHFILPLSEPDENLVIQSYQFAHDRIQQAAYTLISEEERAEKHVAIGHTLLATTSEREREEKLFEIVDQLNQGREILSDREEREKLTRLNLQAGCKAREANAYAAASAYLDAGISLLERNSWQTQYELTLNLYQEAMKAAYLNAEIERMEALAEIIAKEAKTLRDRLELGKIKIDAYTNQRRNMEALTAGLESLAMVGIEFPQEFIASDFALPPDDSSLMQNPFTRRLLVFLAKIVPRQYLTTPTLFPLFILKELIETQTLIGDRQPADLANLPPMQDPIVREALTLLVKIAPAIYSTVPAFLPPIACKQIELSIAHGNAPVSAFSYAGYGMMLCGFGEFSTGYEYGQLALKMLSQFNNKQFEAAILFVVYRYINHWTSHLREAIEPLNRAFKVGLETGDLSYAGYANNGYFAYLYFSGRELSKIERELQHHNKILEAIGQKNALNYNLLLWQGILNLQGKSQHPYRLIGKAIDERSLFISSQKKQNEVSLFIFYTTKATLCYLFEEFNEARKMSNLAQQYLTMATRSFVSIIWCFYNSLVHLPRDRSPIAKTQDLPNDKHKMFLSIVRKNQKSLKRWAKSAPMNYLHKFYLVEAEYHRVIGDKAKAIELYNQAISGARENKYIQEEALANELAAKFYLDWGQEKVAGVYLMEAHYCYSRWGAIAKVKHLEENYPQLCQSQTEKTSPSVTFNPHITSESTENNTLDLATVIKSTNAISSEIVLENLLSTLMNILVENAGAERGILILPRGEHLWVEASKEADSKKISVLQSLAIEAFAKLSSKIVHYVARTGETVVLNDAAVEGNFTDDAYIQQYQCQSIACTPLINQGKLQGIIYLENNLTTGAFTRERMALLRTLATQAAISLENARLYTNMAALNRAYKRFVPSQFLQFLEKESILDVELGDRVQLEMSVLFSDIRGFTTLSEQMTPQENFQFINDYLFQMESAIVENKGFIDKYIGDAIMALFGGNADNAVQAGIMMLERLQIYNQERVNSSRQPIDIGIGINTGSLMLGTVGGKNRMDTTVISDAVNLASRIESLTKNYGVSLLITEQTFSRLLAPSSYAIRAIDTVKVKGKSEFVTVYEVFDADLPEIKAGKLENLSLFQKALTLYQAGELESAKALFATYLARNESDRVAQIYLERCQKSLKQ